MTVQFLENAASITPFLALGACCQDLWARIAPSWTHTCAMSLSRLRYMLASAVTARVAFFLSPR